MSKDVAYASEILGEQRDQGRGDAKDQLRTQMWARADNGRPQRWCAKEYTAHASAKDPGQSKESSRNRAKRRLHLVITGNKMLLCCVSSHEPSYRRRALHLAPELAGQQTRMRFSITAASDGRVHQVLLELVRPTLTGRRITPK